MDRDLVVKVAAHFRDAICSIPKTKFSDECQLHQSFPEGACGETSSLLGRYLLEEFQIDCDYVCGYCIIEGREQETHGWLEYQGYKIDITADQFDDVSEKVIVTYSHRLYDLFETYVPPRKVSTECRSEELDQAYNLILERINELETV